MYIFSRIRLALYFAHLLVPLYLITDVLTTPGELRKSVANIIVLSLSGVWVILGLLPFVGKPWRKHFLHGLLGPLISVWIVYVLIVPMAVGARFHCCGTLRQIPMLYPPGRVHRVVHRDVAVAAGTSAVATTCSSNVGVRGRNLFDKKDYKILAVGGSTTQCNDLDEPKTWCNLLMDDLNGLRQKRRVWVGNAGVSGADFVNDLHLIRTLPIARDANMLLFLIGMNDLTQSLESRGRFNQDALE